MAGDWPPGTVLPNEITLARTFGVAVGTLRRAMSDLVQEGVLARRRRTGTIVTGRPPHHSLRFFFHYFRLHSLEGARLRSTVRMVSNETGPADAGEAASLSIAPGAIVRRLHRVRLIEDRPVMHDRLAFEAARTPGFPESVEHTPDLVYLHLFERYRIRIAAVREQLSAELATSEDAALLTLTRPAAVLAISEVSYDQSAVPTILGTHRATTDALRYVNEVR